MKKLILQTLTYIKIPWTILMKKKTFITIKMINNLRSKVPKISKKL